MTLANPVQTFAESLGLDHLTLRDDGGAQTVVDSQHEVEINGHDGRPGFGLTATVGAMLDDKTEIVALYRHLLEANPPGDVTNGAALSVDHDRHEIVLCRSVKQDEVSYDEVSEPRRVCRRPVIVSYAATSLRSSAA